MHPLQWQELRHVPSVDKAQELLFVRRCPAESYFTKCCYPLFYTILFHSRAPSAVGGKRLINDVYLLKAGRKWKMNDINLQAPENELKKRMGEDHIAKRRVRPAVVALPKRKDPHPLEAKCTRVSRQEYL